MDISIKKEKKWIMSKNATKNEKMLFFQWLKKTKRQYLNALITSIFTNIWTLLKKQKEKKPEITVVWPFYLIFCRGIKAWKFGPGCSRNLQSISGEDTLMKIYWMLRCKKKRHKIIDSTAISWVYCEMEFLWIC